MKFAACRWELAMTKSAQSITTGKLDSLLTIDMANNPLNLIALDDIIDRPMDTRSLNPLHVESLAESIAVLGLIQPIAVDSQGCLLAGGHRLAAIIYLRDSNPTAYAKHFSVGIPVRRYNFDATESTDLALAIEATENEKRRDYTPAEVRDLAERLKAAGYHHTKGRAKADQKSLLPSLSVIIGKSERQIKRYLATKSVNNPNGTDVPFSQKCLKKAIISLREYQNTSLISSQERKLLKELPSIIESLEKAVTETTADKS
jgi:ParB family transcriptional regulator, chromosome partitioning protein